MSQHATVSPPRTIILRLEHAGLALLVGGAHLLYGHYTATSPHGTFSKLILYPLFVASRISGRLHRVMYWRGGWPAAVVESALIALLVVRLGMLMYRRLQGSKQKAAES